MSSGVIANDQINDALKRAREVGQIFRENDFNFTFPVYITFAATVYLLTVNLTVNL